MEIRTIKENEFDDFIKMGEFAFQYELSEVEKQKRKKFMDLKMCWAIFDDGKMVSKLTIHPMEIWMGEKVFSMGGIAGVATWPEHRRKGFVQTLMRKSLEVMKENNQTVSMLYPFSFSFYRKYGWEMTHSIKHYEITPQQIGKRNPSINGIVSRIDHDSDRLDRIYNRFAKRYSGTLKRTKEWWQYSILDNSNDVVAVYQNSAKEDRGYMIYNVKKETMTIDEMVALDGEAKTELLQFIGNHDSMVNKIRLQVPENDDLAFDLSDPKIKQEIKSFFMSRIVDIEAFLKEYPYQSEFKEPIILHVEDKFADWNNGTFIVKSNERGITVEKYKVKEGSSCQHPPLRGLRCDINTLSALFLHHQRPVRLMEKNRILGHEQEITKLEKVINNQQTFLYDSF
ncbi:enhanced intracellular survival protein Eis [Alkalihalobacillus sp. AL-G]|uniref:GNAT family N-acetyltransferase n=1 Tax=Alkalihalobacillus sp. AL-G TaxID=2926399 RepID=UPI002729E1CB|nr:GNAT family N-acetyltransferase [Alkalihalobacillus sp. AL-G]WLD95033.1 GNAT family N-acetyltransferase [Alkalihalobacillus sp. AL-G]